MTEGAREPICAIQLLRARPVSTGVPTTTAWSAARATCRVRTSALVATRPPRSVILLLNSRRLGIGCVPFQILLIQPLNQPDELLSLVFVHPVPLAVLQQGGVGDGPNRHPDVPAGGALQEPVVEQLQTRGQLRSVLDAIWQRSTELVRLFDDLRFRGSLLPAVDQDCPEFPRSASRSSSRNSDRLLACSLRSLYRSGRSMSTRRTLSRL